MNIKMNIEVNNRSLGTGPTLVTKCPSCGHDATFLRIENLSDINVDGIFWIGQRMCPNPSCFGHILFIRTVDKILATFPALRIDFEKQGIPEKVLSIFEEAITCHANQCFTAAAIMIRKALEEICIDKGAAGANLKLRIQQLGSKIIIPKELLEGMDELRLLGNDAAHFESKIFDKIDKEEVEIAIEFTK
ncbi:MAG: DUF4145 domain-containing protein [Deltaproteobacteria bacterium]|nr:DUF4145 domain-containing protein [Deltaproteobacteria bacterium]